MLLEFDLVLFLQFHQDVKSTQKNFTKITFNKEKRQCLTSTAT